MGKAGSFTGPCSHPLVGIALQTEPYQRVLACSDVHLYLTVPFVLSWSLLEAMAAGCCIVASDTAPVREVLTDGTTGVLVDFFSPERQANAIDALCLIQMTGADRLLMPRARPAVPMAARGPGGLDGAYVGKQ